MSTPAPTPAVTAPETCLSCAAPLSDDQRYCLNCGEVRSGARRPMPAAAHGAVASSGEAVVVATRDVAELREGPSIAAVLAGLACLLVAMGVGVLIGRGGGEPTSQAPITIAAAGAPAAVAASFTSDWPDGKDGWTVALALLPKATTTPAAVADAKTAAAGKGAADVGALDADAYPSLTAGSYVVYSGVFDGEKAATAARASLTAAFPAARVVRVGRGTAAAAGGTSTGATKPKSAGGSSGAKPATGSEKAGSADTKKEFEKSKKAPKTVGTGGKPPPKDDKPAAGGGGFEEIG